MKRNLFGSINNEIGQNLMAAIEGCDQTIGILSCNLDAAKQIMANALTKTEYDLLCDGFGIDRPRLHEYEIAKKLGVSNYEVSKRAHAAIQKLQDSPYRVQLRNLTSTPKSVSEEIEELRNKVKAGDSRELMKTHFLLEKATHALKEANELNDKLKAENSSLVYENERLAKKLSDSNEELDRSSKRIVDLTYELRYEKAKANAAKEAFDTAIDKIERNLKSSAEETKKAFLASLMDVKVREDSLKDLYLSEGALNALDRSGIDTLEVLCKRTPRSLTAMVGKSYADEITAKLKVAGFYLAVG